MAQLIATNQLTLTNVNDGKTSYHHWAYSDNADGTGLTLTDNGQRYMGYYTDYTQADSTDKTKYTWADRWAKIEVGGVNLLTGTDEETVYVSDNPDGWKEFLRTPYDLAKVFDKHGLVTYTLSFDLKTAKDGWVDVYQQNGEGSRYSGLYFRIAVTTEWKRYYVTFTPTEAKMELSESFLAFYGVYGTGVVPYARKFKLEKGTVPTDYSRADEDIQADIASKADKEKVVYKTDISVTDEGIIHSASKTVNGQTIASMIAQRAEWVEIIAKLLKVKGDMIVDGTIGANKLSVSTLSALTADLGQISGGSLELLKSEAQATSVDAWGNFTIPAHKWGLYIDNIGAISSGTPVRKSSSESTASDMPVAVLTSGQLRFARVNQNNDLGSVLHNGLSDPDNATISFTVASDGTKQLLIQANGQIVNQGTNYTDWRSTGVSGVYYKRQGDVVALKMQVTTTANQAYGLGKIPVELIPIPSTGAMMRVTAWTAEQSFGRNLQIDGDGSMALLASNRGDTFNTQVTWII